MSRVCLALLGFFFWCLGGCSVLEDNRECPGESCTDELRGVAQRVADLPGVSDVGLVGRYDDLESDPSGLVEVTADTGSLGEAHDLADAVLVAWRSAERDPVRRLEIHVRPTTPHVVPRVVDFTSYGGDGACAAPCRSLLDGLADRAWRLGADPVRVGRDRDDQGRSVWTWRLRARTVQTDSHAAGELANHLVDAARAEGVGEPISMWLDYRAPETFSFSWKRGEGMSVSP